MNTDLTSPQLDSSFECEPVAPLLLRLKQIKQELLKERGREVLQQSFEVEEEEVLSSPPPIPAKVFSVSQKRPEPQNEEVTSKERKSAQSLVKNWHHQNPERNTRKLRPS